MPGGDRTGPTRMGPMTGRRMGHCTGYDHPDYSFENYGFRDFRGGGSWGGNRKRWFSRPEYGYENIPTGTERSLLENEINALKNQLSVLENRLNSFNKEE